jgi:transposase
VSFLGQVVSGCKPKQEVHVILDNLSAHKTAKVRTLLEEHPHVHLPFTPTYSSWLNQVEIWFARIEREVIAGGVFTSVRDLARKLMRYIRAYSKTARPFKWRYTPAPASPGASMLTHSLRQAT